MFTKVQTTSPLMLYMHHFSMLNFFFQASAAYSTVGLSLLRTAMMMLELDYMASFNEPFTDNDPSTLYYGETVIFLLACFVLLMPILLMNLLVSKVYHYAYQIRMTIQHKLIYIYIYIHKKKTRLSMYSL